MIVQSTKMTPEQLKAHLDLRQGSRSSKHKNQSKWHKADRNKWKKVI
jgi:hypothetical protein